MSANDIHVPGRLTSAKPDKTIAGANEILDDDIHLKQSAINALTKKVVTLNSAPTSSTLTYTYNGVTCNFAIGDEVRVEDSKQGSSETNEYIYYKLFDIDNGVAYWDLVGSGAGGGTGQIGELVSISLITNQNDNSDLIGANIKVFNTDDTSEVFLETTWQGNPIELEIQVPINYTIQVGNVNGYSTPAVQTYSSRTIRTRNVTFQYNTEVVTVTVNTNASGVTAEGQVVTINGVNTTVPASGVISQKVPYGTSYSVSVNSKGGYNSPATQSFTANSVSRSVTMTYTKISNGIYAVTTTGDYVAYENINTSSPGSYVGVAVLDQSKNMSFMIDKRFPTGSAAAANVSNCKAWSAALYMKDQSYLTNISTAIGDGQSISTAAPTDTRNAAFNAYNNGETGVVNTTNLVNDSNASSENASNNAAKYCRSIVNPVTGSYDGYLGSLAEWIVVNDNQVIINQILNAIGGVAFASTNSGSVSGTTSLSYYWTSSEFNSNFAWDWYLANNLSFALCHRYYKSNPNQYLCVRTFFPL